MSDKPNRCHCGGLRHKHDMERIARLEMVAEEAVELFQNYGDEMDMEFTDLEQFLLEAGYLKDTVQTPSSVSRNPSK